MAQLTPIKGFTNTPVSRSLCVIGTVLALGVSILQIKHYFRMGLDPYIVQYWQYWRLGTFQMVMTSESDYLLGILLLFQFKPLERYYGSRKYLSMICVYYVYNMAICFLLMCLGQTAVYFIGYVMPGFIRGSFPVQARSLFNEVAPGPFGLISSLYVDYGRFVPVSYRFKVLLTNIFKKQDVSDESETMEEGGNVGVSKSLTLTNHFSLHVIYTLFILNRGFASVFPCLVGLLIGKLNANGLLPGSMSWLIPQFAFYAIASPKRLTRYTRSFIRNRLHFNYQPLSSQEETNAEIIDNDNAIGIEDDRVEDLEGSRNEENEIRAETPVRTLRSQFLDTFRT